ncbi:MAG: DNA primase [Thermus sp.]|uniref:DNA primase n=1 Tax=Thermus sp. TaxID=275 RepID=UPI00331FA2B2
MNQVVEAVKSRLSLKEVVSRYVVLRPAGKGRWKGLCPFHQEKTPSFYVDEDKGLFYCFGCKAGGDLIQFVERIEGLDFKEALRRLAEEAGVAYEAPPESRKRELLWVLEEAQRYFQKGLEKSPQALAYLKGRGLWEETIHRFGLGYAPASFEGLTAHLRKQGIPLEEGIRAGVLAEKEGRVFDRFRNRITFPIKDALGRVVAFSGRTLEASSLEPKYLNSPETALFRKREVLFAYPEARPRLREGRAILVEGLLDAIALHQLGFQESVAVLGSSLSEEQALLLKKQGVQEIYLAFDRDEAGRRATLQSLEREVVRGFLVYAVLLPVKDPGELLLLPEGRDVFAKALAEALPEVEFRMEEATRGLDLTRPEHKRKVLEALAPRMLSPEPFDPVAERLKALVVERLGLSRRALEDFLAGLASSRNQRPPPPPPPLEKPNKTLLLELDVIALILSAPDSQLPKLVQHVAGEVWPPAGSLLGEFLETAKKEPRKDWLRLYFGKKPEGGALFERLLLAPPEEAGLMEKLEHALARLREAYHLERLEALKAELKRNPSQEVLKEIQEVMQAIEAERRTYKKP